MNNTDAALVALLKRLESLSYDFVTPTPATQARVVLRADGQRAPTLRDVFGWSLPVAPELLPLDLTELLDRGDALDGDRCRYRVSRLGGRLFLHSAYPTDQVDSVFLGPDTHRFVRFLRSNLGGVQAGRLVDMGAGTGAGAIAIADLLPGTRLTLVDSNPEALRLARINAAAAGVEVEALDGTSLADVEGAVDLVIANPPFLVDEGGRAYRHGGDMLGARLSLDWALEAAGRVSPGGRMLLYTGSAIVRGRDGLRAALEAQLPPDCTLAYEEIDPDIFGEELERPAYRDVERIAAVGAVIRRGS